MGVVRLAACVSGVYAAFLLWAIAQERLSVPFASIPQPIRPQPPHPDGFHPGDRFPSPLFLNFAQALASGSSAFLYLLFLSYRDGTLGTLPLSSILGLHHFSASLRAPHDQTSQQKPIQEKIPNGDGNWTRNASEQDVKKEVGKASSWRKSLPALLVQVSLFQTLAGPLGFFALRHISYPTMVLGKSCKLVPVMMLNVILYRRKFAPHKYLVVALVTVGISMFMLFANASRKGGSNSSWGLTLLSLSLFVDGFTNSTQDQIFSSYPAYTGQQMMFAMALLQQIILLPAILLPLPSHPFSIFHYLPFPFTAGVLPDIPPPALAFSTPAAIESIRFLLTHPSAISPLLAYALLGGLGQLFIFETIQHFGSLTLVMVTVTRKLFTMLLSVLVFKHTLLTGQWLGVVVVFGGIGVEARMKRRDVMRKARRD